MNAASSDSLRLAEFSKAVRESSLKRLKLVPESLENWTASPGSMSFADLAHHLIEADEWLFRKLDDSSTPAMVGKAGVVTILRRAQYESLVDRLTVLGAIRAERIASLSIPELERLLPDERFGGEVSVWWVITRGNLDHEAHHRGQLAAWLRALRLSIRSVPT
ncbi:MAG: DinB family protein [Acidobacteriota bacterium]